jgi:4-carboxymuconolactone decarboxylase
MSDAEMSDRYEQGIEIMRKIGSDPNGPKGYRKLDPVVGPALDRMLGEFCFGDVWAREALDLRTRRVITLTALAAQGKERAMPGHIKGALNQGFSRQEILEVFVQMIPYVGFPTTLAAIEVATNVFAEMDKK